MKVACIQLNSGENYKKNCSQLLKYINKSIKLKADLILTPEFSTILSSNHKIIYKNSFYTSEDPFLKKVKLISKIYKKWILIGSLPIKTKKKILNRSILLNPKGEIESYYDKINMFDVKLPNGEKHFESKLFRSGKKIKIANLPWGKIGFTICFDLRFPELYRKLSKKNVNFITVPSAFAKETGKKHWVALLRARAIENFCYILAPAQYGKNAKGRETFGHTAIISPDGEIIALKKTGIGLLIANIDPFKSQKLRKVIPSLKY